MASSCNVGSLQVVLLRNLCKAMKETLKVLLVGLWDSLLKAVMDGKSLGTQGQVGQDCGGFLSKLHQIQEIL